ncbi:hypothetical protein B0H16DRAFT_642115 [Mycena metata]|uniref:Uncharacterized protein n=1 Tax=Mycena metata TaxID=1033252 RepID=A0AAD7J794_9AGAR|nr:hypothetical protein B0H16DRAFT_642115 [Mycena metata]
MSETVQEDPVRIRFPPFPPVPDGVAIVPFEDFQESGTRVVGTDGVERDGLGIPTIVLVKPLSKKRQRSAAVKDLRRSKRAAAQLADVTTQR